tara:strand:- start:744 stop:2144 length:1401 start_codon:yes stop_codon:yes gene_type:complete
MEQEVKTTFAQEQVQTEPTERDRITERIQNYKVGVSPQQAQAVSAVINNGLSAGIFKVGDLDMLSSISKDLESGLIQYNQSVETATRRLNEIAEEELVVKQQELAKREQMQEQKLEDERTLRKSTQDKLEQAQVSMAQMEAVLKSHGIHIDLDGDGVVGLKEGQQERNLTPEELAEVNRLMQESRDAVKVSKDNITTAPTKSKAWEMVRAMNPEPDTDTPPPDPMESWDEPVKKSSYDTPAYDDPVEEQLELEIEPRDPIPEEPKTFADFVDEVEKVEQESEERSSGLYHHLKNKPITKDEGLNEKIEETKEAFRLYDEDTETEPTLPQSHTSAPFVTGGNAPSLKEQIPSYDSEEELLDAIADKHANDEPEPEEFEEITIPDRVELESMTTDQILESASDLGFDVPVPSDDDFTKEDLIDIFEQETERFISDLQETGELQNLEYDVPEEDDADSRSSNFGYPEKD